MEQRLNRLRNRLREHGLEALLVLRPENRYYLSGFTGSNGYLLVKPDETVLLTDGRYTTQAAEQAPHCRAVIATALAAALREELQRSGIKQLGFEKDFVTYEQYQIFHELFAGIELQPTSGHVEALRLIKDEGELAILRQAANIADAAFAHILNYLKPGISELDVSLELETFMRKQGAKSSSFEIIVASGARSALPHGKASDKVLEHGDFVKLDFGAYYQGYCSDITRTVVLGEATDRHREIYDLVLKAQTHAVANIKAGITGVEADKLARDIIATGGYGEQFSHTLGHGLGLAVHEAPSLSHNRGDQVLQPGMVVTVEPGIYLPGFGGVRIEDDIVITADGNEVLTKSPKEFLVIG